MDVANLKHSSLTLADGRMRGVATQDAEWEGDLQK